MKLVEELAIEEAKLIVSGWNGKDDKFIINGEIYTEDNVQEAQALLDEKENL